MSVLIRWYAALLAGALPVLVLGFAVSALANRMSFVFWGLATALLYAMLLRYGWQDGWRPRSMAGAALSFLALAMLGFSALAFRNQEALGLGVRAFSPALEPLLLIEPRWILGAAALLLLTVAGPSLLRQAARRWKNERQEEGGGEAG